MISYQEACALLRSNIQVLPVEELPLSEALARVLSEDVFSKSDSPRFDNSAVDGYAFHFEKGQKSYKVIGEIAAGEQFQVKLVRGECARIFTGAMMPLGADTCVMQEYVSRSGVIITHTDVALKQGANVRLKGEELEKGSLLIEKGTRINSVAIGLLSACGITVVNVHKRAKIHVLVTGNEFTIPSNPEEGKIFNSNGPMLQAALDANGYRCSFSQINDDPDELLNAVENALAQYDIVISTGGVSVGDHDHVRATCEEVGLNTIFHKVAQKPGKPMYYAKAQGRHFLGLPGNPRAVMVAFYMHVLPFLQALEGSNNPGLAFTLMPLATDLKLKGSRTELLAVQLLNNTVHVSKGQNSHMLSSLAQAHGIAVIPANQRLLLKGDSIQVFVI